MLASCRKPSRKKQEIMGQSTILALTPGHPGQLESLENEFRIIRLWKERDPDEAIRANAPDNPANGPDGGRGIWAGDEMVGYYTRNGGTLNLFDRQGRRVAYRPGGGHTRSLFSPDGRWCGTVADTGGGMAFGLTQACAGRFFR